MHFPISVIEIKNEMQIKAKQFYYFKYFLSLLQPFYKA